MMIHECVSNDKGLKALETERAEMFALIIHKGTETRNSEMNPGFPRKQLIYTLDNNTSLIPPSYDVRSHIKIFYKIILINIIGS